MNSTTSVWHKIMTVLQTVGPQVINIVLMSKDLLPAKWGAVISAALGFGTYALHVYHDVQTNGLQALAQDVPPTTSTTVNVAA